jgi:hypothetical protein
MAKAGNNGEIMANGTINGGGEAISAAWLRGNISMKWPALASENNNVMA